MLTEPLGEAFPGGHRPGRPDRAQLHVAIEHEPTIVDLAVEVDRQLRNTGDRLADVDERRRPVGSDHPPGDAQVTVEPTVQQHTAVDLDAEELPVGDGLVGVGVDAQARRVGVRPHDAHARRAAVGQAPGNESATPPGEPSGRERCPPLRLVELDETAGQECLGGGAGGVPWRW